MKKVITKVIQNPLISGSSVLFTGLFVANLINFSFNFLMVRLLSKSDYGLLITVSSFFILLGLFQQSFQSIFAKFTAVYYARSEIKYIKYLINFGFRAVGGFSLALLVLFIILTPILMNFLHVTSIWILPLSYITICALLMFSLPTGILQGQLRFLFLSFVNFIQPILKIMFGVSLVLLGFGLTGAVLGITIATVLAAGIMIFYIFKVFSTTSSIHIKDSKLAREFLNYGRGFLITSVGLTLLSNTDILLVRHYFAPDITGLYAAVSLMGKSIFYLTAPLNFVFFPLIAYKKERGEKLLPTLLLAIGLIAAASFAISLFYFFTPQLIITIFTGGKYKAAAPYLGIFSLYILVFSVASVLNSFFLSIGKTRIYMLTLSAAIIQIILIALFHSSLYSVIWILTGISLLLSLSFLAYYCIHGKD